MRERALLACVWRRVGASFSLTAPFVGGEREGGPMPIVGARPGWVGSWRAVGGSAGLPELPAAADARCRKSDRHLRGRAGPGLRWLCLRLA